MPFLSYILSRIVVTSEASVFPVFTLQPQTFLASWNQPRAVGSSFCLEGLLDSEEDIYEFWQ